MGPDFYGSVGTTFQQSGSAPGDWMPPFLMGSLAAGPCPTLFNLDPDAALKALRADGAKAHYNIQRMLRAFFSHEIVNLRDAVAIMKKPR